MNRTRIIFTGLTVVMLVLLAAGGYFLISSAAAAREAREQRDAAYSRLQALYQSNPFPDDANTERMNQHVLLLGQMRATMTNALAQRDVPLPELSPSRFIQNLQRTLRDRLLPQAPIVEGGRVVPDDFTFGFERYLVANAPMPAEADVPRLAQQLTIVENLVGEVYAAQVVALRSIEREVFEESVGDRSATDTRRSRRRSGRGDTGGAAATSSAPASDLYRSQRFTLVVEGRQASIGTLLNRLACMPMFVVSHDVEMRKKADDLRPPPSAEQGAAASATAQQPVSLFAQPQAASPATPAAGSPAAAEAEISELPPSRRLVSGREIDPVIEARIMLDVFNFNREGI